MSLSGLDDPAIIESYQTALSEAGGWFLLKYVGRDVLDLLGRGTGGVAEIKVSIDGYGEKSPLYGFLQYRRRKVVLRYVPEGISRLVQARITVQFQSFLDKFSPHDTVFSLSVSTELTESALSSACSLHTASGSMTSSSSSLRRRRLVEITEDAEENGVSSKEEPQTLTVERDTDALSQRSDTTAVPTHREPTKDTDTRSTRTNSTSKPERDISAYEEDKPPATHQQHFLDQLSQPSAEPRKSSQSTRPSTRDLDLASLYRPKVKLGPRPSADNTGRPRTAGSLNRKQEPRPVATLPAGIRSSASQRSNTSRPKSQPSSAGQPPNSSRNIPPVPSFSIQAANAPAVPRPPLSPSVRSVMTTPESGITPEKQRLMRALELRQKQMEKRAEEKKKLEEKEPKVEVEEVANTDSKANTDSVAENNQQDSVEEPSHDAVTHDEQTQETPPLEPTSATDTKPPSPDLSKPDSAVDIVVTDPYPVKAVESNSGTMPTSTPDAVDVPTDEQKLPPGEPDVTEGPQEEASEASHVPKESHVAEKVQALPESDTGLQDSEQDSSSVNETGSPSHETSTTTIDVPEIDPVDPKANGESPDKAAEMVTEDDTNSHTSKNVNHSPSIDAERELDKQESITGEKGVSENETEPEGLETKAEASETQNTDTPAETPVVDGPERDDIPTAGTDEIELDKSQSNDNSISDEPSGNSSSTERPVDQGEEQRKNKRRALIDPIQISNDHGEFDDDNLLSDDSFMDELTSATVQEAKPVSVGKSPITSSFAGNDDERPSGQGSRAVSNPNFKHPLSGDLQALPIGRSASGSYFDRSQEVPVLVAKKVNVSSGISKRIKALEMFSSREPSPVPTAPQPTVTPAPSSSAFEKFRKRASISQSNLPSGLAPSPKPGQNLTPSPSSESNASKPHTPSRKDSAAGSNSRGKSNSVSVTARIVRENSTSQSEPSSDHPESNVLNLQCSPLIVERDTEEEKEEDAVVPQTSTAPKSDNRSLSVSSGTGSRRNSFASILPRSDSTASRLSGSSKSKTESGSRSTGDLPSSPLDSVDENKEEKRQSRKSRFLRRMSSITSNSRRGVLNSLSPTVTEEEAPPSPTKEVDSTPVPPQVVDIGEVNVQFPDTLLWKRRFMRIDDQGYLIMTAGNTDGSNRNMVKRYHLSEFKTPCLPDHDRQELPNSILLDFCDGNTLQCACESRQGQNDLLQTLVEAHSAYIQVHER